MTQLATILTAVRTRLTDPRAWLQGNPKGYRDDRGAVVFFRPANCWCVSYLISVEIDAVFGRQDVRPIQDQTWTELRSDIERELLATLDELGIRGAAGEAFHATYRWNDAKTTSHVEILRVLDRTIERVRVVG